jgi:hypothetical protein
MNKGRRNFIKSLLLAPLLLILPKVTNEPDVTDEHGIDDIKEDEFFSDEYYLLNGYDSFEWCQAMAQRGKEFTFEGLDGYINTAIIETNTDGDVILEGLNGQTIRAVKFEPNPVETNVSLEQYMTRLNKRFMDYILSSN